MTLILDASAALAWVFLRPDPEENTRANEVLETLDERDALVPSLWHVEVTHAIRTAQRQRRITLLDATDFLDRLDGLPIRTDNAAVFLKKELLELAYRYNLGAYDAAYLELALRTGAALFTFDDEMARARDAAGIADQRGS